MRPQIILRYVGLVLLFNALFLLISCIISGFNVDSAFFPLLYTALISALFGAFPLIFVSPITKITNKEGFTIVILYTVTTFRELARLKRLMSGSS
ncbi:MAG: hypothetical protein HWN70_11560 [Desulfobacterales bacterium]|nr:hypothetical protein [Desulfobacterales bacterium]